MRRPAFFLTLFAAFAPLTAAHADDTQSATDAPADTIVVQGQKETFARNLRAVQRTIVTQDGQVPRFDAPICTYVAGLPPSYARVAKQEMDRVASEAGLELGKPGCAPNLTLLVADDGAEAVAVLRKARPALFEGIDKKGRLALEHNPGPAWVWRNSEIKRADGGPVRHIATFDFGGGAPPIPTADGAYTVEHAEMSRLKSTFRVDLDSAFVVIETGATDGCTLAQLAGYAAMAGLAPVSLDPGNASQGSILSLFAAPSPELAPQGATEFDIGYLRGLYAGAPNLSGDRRMAQIARTIGAPLP